MTDPADLSAAELLAAYAGRSLSPVEVTEAVIGRIEAWEPRLNALYAYDPDGARAAGEGIGGTLARRRGAAARRRALHDQGEHRDKGRARAARHGSARPRARHRGRASRRRGCARPAASSSPRRRCRITACSPRGSPASTSWRAIPGTCRRPPAAPRPGPERRQRPAMARCMSAPISAARSACRPAGAGSSG